MKRRFTSIILAFAMSLSLFCGVAGAIDTNELTILFTHDTHSSLTPFNVENDSETESLGGFARLQTVINNETNKATSPVILLDAGDFSMGTLFQTIFSSNASELHLLSQLGYDATTLGNHEFDFGTLALADMLNVVSKSNLPIKVLFDAGDLDIKKHHKPKTSVDALADAFFNSSVTKTHIIERKGLKIGLFSVFGDSSLEYTPTMELEMPNVHEAAKKSVAALQDDGADIIICLSHSGTDPNPKKSEDELLAKAVPGIDVIISGHTHSTLDDPIVVGGTTIVSGGERAMNLGKLVVKKSDENWTVSDYSLYPINSDIEENIEANKAIAMFSTAVEETYLTNFGDLSLGEPVADLKFIGLKQEYVYLNHAESSLANLIGDSYLYALKDDIVSTETLAVVPAGTVRAGLAKGELTLSDVYDVSSLGIGADGISGYPLITVYLSGKELRDICEVDASITPLMNEAQLFISGLSYEFNPNRLIFNKVTRVNLQDNTGNLTQINDNQLYRIVCGLYSAQMLSAVKSKSFNLLSIVPKDENGIEISDFNTRILKNQNGSEKKEWFALLEYIQSFDKAEGSDIPSISEYYSETHDRKLVSEDNSLFAFFSQPNKIALGVYSIVFVLLLLLVIVIILIKRKIKKSKKNKVHSYSNSG